VHVGSLNLMSDYTKPKTVSEMFLCFIRRSFQSAISSVSTLRIFSFEICFSISVFKVIRYWLLFPVIRVARYLEALFYLLIVVLCSWVIQV
jgi:hypothetical protein